MPIWLIAGLVGAVLGGGGVGAFALVAGKDSGADAVEATAAVVEQSAAVVEEAGNAANAERLAELEVSRTLAAAPAAVVVCRAAVESDAEPRTVALCSYALCLSHVEGSETSAGLGCLERGKSLDLLIRPDAP